MIPEKTRDEHIRKEWLYARRLYRSRSHLGKMLALRICDDLEAAGVTDADIERLFPLDPIRSAMEGKAQ